MSASTERGKMTMIRFVGSASRRPLPGSRPDGRERGFLIVLSLLVLFTLTLLGMTSIINATIETKIAANENFANQSFYAADSGIAEAVAKLNNGTVVPVYTNVDWSDPADSDADLDTKDEAAGDYNVRVQNDTVTDRGLTNRYRWYMQFKRDLEDQDGDCPGGATATDPCYTELVYFNNSFQYTQSLFTGAAGDVGYPVIVVTSEGLLQSGTATDAPVQSERGLELEIGRNHFDVAVEGAITARSNVSLTGNIDIDGNNHDINGNPGGSCGQDMPGAFVDAGKVITSGGSSDLGGKDCTAAGVFCDCNGDGIETLPADQGCAINDGSVTLPIHPWDVLGLDETAFNASFSDIAPGAVVEPLSGNIYVNGDYDMESGSGILIVHNPLFDAEVWEVSTAGSPAYNNTLVGVYDPKLDSSNAAYDAAWRTARQPAKFAAHGNGTYKGVVIADSVDKINGTTTFIGAVVSLTSVDVANFGNGAATILFSCEAISQMAQVGYSTKLVWRKR